MIYFRKNGCKRLPKETEKAKKSQKKEESLSDRSSRGNSIKATESVSSKSRHTVEDKQNANAKDNGVDLNKPSSSKMIRDDASSSAVREVDLERSIKISSSNAKSHSFNLGKHGHLMTPSVSEQNSSVFLILLESFWSFHFSTDRVFIVYLVVFEHDAVSYFCSFKSTSVTVPLLQSNNAQTSKCRKCGEVSGFIFFSRYFV